MDLLWNQWLWDSKHNCVGLVTHGYHKTIIKCNIYSSEYFAVSGLQCCDKPSNFGMEKKIHKLLDCRIGCYAHCCIFPVEQWNLCARDAFRACGQRCHGENRHQQFTLWIRLYSPMDIVQLKILLTGEKLHQISRFCQCSSTPNLLLAQSLVLF